MVASVDKITDKDEFVVRQITSFGEEVLDVVELTMNVSGEIYGGINTDDIAFFGQDSLDLVA